MPLLLMLGQAGDAEPEPDPTPTTSEGVEGGARPGYVKRAKRRKELRDILADDNDFLQFAMKSLPEILRNIFK